MSTNKKSILIKKARENTGKLLYMIIEGAISPFDAIKYFPKNIEDTSLKIAWHALLHYDADEDMRKSDSSYAQEQILYIETLAKILSAGNKLPQNMLQDYEAIYKTTVLPKHYNWLGKIKAFFRFLN